MGYYTFMIFFQYYAKPYCRLFQTLSSTIGHMVKNENFLYGVEDIFIFVMLSINWWKKWLSLSSIAKIQNIYIFCMLFMQ